MFFFEFFGLGLFGLAFYWYQTYTFEIDTDEADPTIDPNEIEVESLYTSAFELGNYQWKNLRVKRLENNDFDFLFFFNVSRYNKSSYYNHAFFKNKVRFNDNNK